MEQKDWAGVFPAMTTPFQPDLAVDYAALETQVEGLVTSGCARPRLCLRVRLQDDLSSVGAALLAWSPGRFVTRWLVGLRDGD